MTEEDRERKAETLFNILHHKFLFSGVKKTRDSRQWQAEETEISAHSKQLFAAKDLEI